MKILDLVVKQQWYDLMISGVKTEEFRDDSEHWRKRIIKNGEIADFEIIRIRCGYSSVFTDFKNAGIYWRKAGISRQYGEDVRLEMPGPLFVIKLGKCDKEA